MGVSARDEEMRVNDLMSTLRKSVRHRGDQGVDEVPRIQKVGKGAKTSVAKDGHCSTSKAVASW